MDGTQEFAQDSLLLVGKILSLPIEFLAWLIATVKAKRYDPEKIVCPSCGFRGDSGTNGKSCRISFVRITEGSRAALRHTCFRCGCNEIYTALFYEGSKWLHNSLPTIEEKIKEAAAKQTL